MEDDGDGKEEDEEDDLDEQTGGDNFLPAVHRVFRLAGRDSGSYFLSQRSKIRGFGYTSCSPNACVTKDNTSPATNILVSQVNLTSE